jgi:alpha-L-fucosidase
MSASGGAAASGGTAGTTSGSAGAGVAGRSGSGSGGAATGGATATGGAAGSAATGGAVGVAGASGASGAGGKPTGGGGAAASTGGASGGAGGAAPPARTLEQLQRDYVDLRFGIFLSFGILTYTGSWAQPNLPIAMFNPTKLDAGQWADAAVSAHAKYGLLITRHHDGFALWPSAVGNFSVKNIPWRSGQGDVVKEYVDAFRARGLLPGLYYSIWDSTEGIGNGVITPAQLAYVKAQLTELLTNYGPIPILVFDGWAWKTGHQTVAYQEIRTLVKSLQPDCLMTDHTHLADPWDVDIVNFEEPTGVFSPPTNTYAAAQEQKVNATGGNDWFWAPGIGSLMTTSDIVDAHLKKLEPAWTNFLLNCPPNRDGLLDPAMVTLLASVGAAWSPDLTRAPLPAQGAQNDYPYTPLSATATSGTAANAIDGRNDTASNTLWQTTGALPQSITLDLGQARPDVGFLGYLPAYANNKGTTTGNITSYAVLVSTDNTTFTMATMGTWAADGKWKTATFGPVAARYVRLEARGVNSGTSAVATEITVGAKR